MAPRLLLHCCRCFWPLGHSFAASLPSAQFSCTLLSQAYDVAGIAPLTSNDLMYPDHQLMQQQQQHQSSLGGLRDLNLSHDLHHPGSLHQPTELGSAEGLANGHTEQDMEKFINIFLQVSAYPPLS